MLDEFVRLSELFLMYTVILVSLVDRVHDVNIGKLNTKLKAIMKNQEIKDSFTLGCSFYKNMGVFHGISADYI